MKHILMLLIVLFIGSSTFSVAFADSAENAHKALQNYKALFCSKNPDYCKMESDLLSMQLERNSLAWALFRSKVAYNWACESTEARQVERLSFDPIANRFPQISPCTSYKQHAAELQPRLDRVNQLTNLVRVRDAEIASVQAQLVELSKELVK